MRVSPCAVFVFTAKLGMALLFCFQSCLLSSTGHWELHTITFVLIKLKCSRTRLN